MPHKVCKRSIINAGCYCDNLLKIPKQCLNLGDETGHKDTRKRAIEAWKSGTPINDICRVVGINRRTFYTWRKRDAEGGDQVPLPKGHRPRLLDKQQILEIKRLVEENNSLSAREIMMKLGIECHLGVIYRALEELGFTFKKKK